jgi:serine protease Do
MRRCLLPIAGALFAVAMAPARAQPAPVPTDAEMVRGLMPTVVNIRVIEAARPPPPGAAASAAGLARPRVMSGSGFVVDPSGLIVTNNHVIDGAYDIVVTFADGESLPATVVEPIHLLDLALLRVSGDRPRPAVRWAEEPVQPGDEVFAFGNPLGIGLSVTAGIVSATNRNLDETGYDHFIQTDAVINHGNSGGPLFNTRGEVVGVDTAIVSPTQGYAGLGFAIPSETVRFVIDRVRQYGWLRPGLVGLRATRVTQDIAEALGQPRPEGLLVAAVVSGGPADKAGLRVGDVLLSFGDVTPSDDRALQRAIIAAPIGQAVPVRLRRAGKPMTLPVTVAEWNRDDYDRDNGADSTARPVLVRHDLGLTFGAITDDMRARHGLVPGQTGVVVTGVMAGTDAWLRGISVDDVVSRVDDVSVTNAADVQREVDRARALDRRFALFLVRQKDGGPEEPVWKALRIANDPAAAAVVAKGGK